MFTVILATVIRTIILPIVFFHLLKATLLGESNALLAVVVTLTIVNVISIFPKLLKLIMNGMLFRLGKVQNILVKMLIEILATAGFWYYLIMNY